MRISASTAEQRVHHCDDGFNIEIPQGSMGIVLFDFVLADAQGKIFASIRNIKRAEYTVPYRQGLSEVFIPMLKQCTVMELMHAGAYKEAIEPLTI
jgi:hypothetical protein